MNDLASVIDHTLLKADATADDIRRLCAEAAHYRFYSVCVNPFYVALCKWLVLETPVKVCAVVGFPLGATTAEAKACEAARAVSDGADEVDMVIAIGALKSGDEKAVLADVRAVRKAVAGKVLKVIIETGYLSNEEKVTACLLAQKADADFVKTSTGFGAGGATEDDIRLMRRTVGPAMGIKASGGIRTREAALRMLQAGATRIGASASVKIVSEQ
jgi:deoxyribose-phosphate aldolase